jgi:hypothetical protein
MNTPVVFLVFLVLAVVVGIAYSARATGKVAKLAEEQASPADPRIQTLRYRVPDGQDPAVLIAALEPEGYTADLEVLDAARFLVIACPAGRDRERARVRHILAEHEVASLEGPPISPGKPIFEDETQ